MTHPYLMNPTELAKLSSEIDDVIIIDVRTEEAFDAGHLPGARRLDYARMIHSEVPVGGLLPDANSFNEVLRSLGVNEKSHVVSYDQDGGAAASRLLWTLRAFGFERISLLSGGIQAWIHEGFATVTEAPEVMRSNITLSATGLEVIEVDELVQKLGNESLGILDARTIEEFTGENVRAEHGGRIPGAQHFEWTDALDASRQNRLLPDKTLQQMLDERGLTKEKEIIVYCQTHQRSALSYVMLKHLGYDNVKALNGAWSNWGNRDDTPKEIG